VNAKLDPGLHYHAAINGQTLAGNVFGISACQEGDSGGDIFGLTKTA
jgi:hypothetical protein